MLFPGDPILFEQYYHQAGCKASSVEGLIIGLFHYLNTRPIIGITVRHNRIFAVTKLGW